MNKKLKAFTLVEMMIVLIIIFIMFNALKTVLSFSQRDFINSQTCANKASARIISQLNNALTSKIIFSGATKIFPTSYGANIFSTGIVGYVYSGDQKIVLSDYSLVLSGDQPNISECYSKNYKLVASGNNFVNSIDIRKGLSFDQKDVFVINSGSVNTDGKPYLTGEIKFLQCVGNEPCKDISKLIFDKRSLSIVQTKCTKRNGSKCVSVGY